MHQAQQAKNPDATNKVTEPTTRRWSVVTPVLMVAGSLFPSKQLPAQQPELPTASSTATDLVKQERDAAALQEIRAWQRKLGARIPTTQLEDQSLATQIARLRSFISSDSITEEPPSFLVKDSNGESLVILSRLKAVAKYSQLSEDEIKKKVFEHLQATSTLRQHNRAVDETIADIEYKTPARLILQAERLIEKRNESEKELLSHNERLGKMEKTVEYLRELEGLLQEKSPATTPRLKQLSRLLGIKELQEVDDQISLMEPLLRKHQEASESMAAALSKTAERVQSLEDREKLEKCEHFEAISFLEKRLEKQVAAAQKNARKYESASQMTLGHLIYRDKAEQLQRDITKAEVKLLWHSGTVSNQLGNTAAQVALAFNINGETTLFVAVNDPAVRISAEDSGERTTLNIKGGAPLTCRSLDSEATVARFLDGSTDLVFKDEKGGNSFPNVSSGQIRNIELFLAPEASFDMQGLSNWKGTISVNGSGTLILGEKAKRDPYQVIKLERGCKVGILTPKPTQPLEADSITLVGDLIGVRGLQARVHVPRGDGDTHVDIVVRGYRGDVVVPLLRGGKQLEEANEIVGRINAVK